MQLYEELKNKGMIGIGKDTVAKYGVRGLYRGLTPLLAFSIPKSAVRFWAFEEAKKRLVDDRGILSIQRNFIAGFFAGTMEAILVVTPMETMKVKLIHDQLSANPKYRGLIHGVSSIAKEQGISGCYKGLLPTILKQGSNQMLRFATFNGIKKLWVGEDPKLKFNIFQSVVAGVIAGAVSVFGNTPIDVVKTRMQGLESSKYKGTLDCILQIARKEGLMAFYKGTTPRLTRVCLDVAIQMTLYDQIMYLFDRFMKRK